MVVILYFYDHLKFVFYHIFKSRKSHCNRFFVTYTAKMLYNVITALSCKKENFKFSHLVKEKDMLS